MIPVRWKSCAQAFSIACRYRYGYALGWLNRARRLHHELEPAARWPSKAVRGYLADMQTRLSSATVLNRVLSLERALAVIAPESDRAMLRALVRRLPGGQATSKKRRRLRDPAQLVELGMRLMAAAEACHYANLHKNATVYRDGLQIALLALRPFRKRNFAGLKIGTHLVQQNGAWWLVISSDETKTGQPIEVPFPEQLVPHLERYLRHHRPLLAANRYRGDHLWLTYWHTEQAPHSIQLQISERTRESFGTSINPHLFRDCVATSIAIHDPENVRMAATILGHRSFATTERHYNLACSLEAGEDYASVIGRRRMANCRGRRGA